MVNDADKYSTTLITLAALCLQWKIKYLIIKDCFPGGLDGKESACNAGDWRLILDQEVSLENGWQPTPIFLSGEFHGQRSPVGYSPWGFKELDMTEWLSNVICLYKALLCNHIHDNFREYFYVMVRDSSWLIGKDPDAGRDWGQEEKGATEDEMAGWHHRCDGHEFE